MRNALSISRKLATGRVRVAAATGFWRAHASSRRFSALPVGYANIRSVKLTDSVLTAQNEERFEATTRPL